MHLYALYCNARWMHLSSRQQATASRVERLMHLRLMQDCRGRRCRLQKSFMDQLWREGAFPPFIHSGKMEEMINKGFETKTSIKRGLLRPCLTSNLSSNNVHSLAYKGHGNVGSFKSFSYYSSEVRGNKGWVSC